MYVLGIRYVHVVLNTKITSRTSLDGSKKSASKIFPNSCLAPRSRPLSGGPDHRSPSSCYGRSAENFRKFSDADFLDSPKLVLDLFFVFDTTCTHHIPRTYIMKKRIFDVKCIFWMILVGGSSRKVLNHSQIISEVSHNPYKVAISAEIS